MLTITDPACDHLSKLLAEAKAPDEAAIRMVTGERGLELRVDSPKPGDTTIDREGKPLVVLDEQLAERLGDRTLDIRQTPAGVGLALV